jgi:hypothetical protein
MKSLRMPGPPAVRLKPALASRPFAGSKSALQNCLQPAIERGCCYAGVSLLSIGSLLAAQKTSGNSGPNW